MIKNINELITGRFSKERVHALSAVEKALERVMPQKCIPNFLKTSNDALLIEGHTYKVSDFQNIYVIAFGKAAEEMAVSLFNSLPQVFLEKIKDAVVITKEFKKTLPPFVKKIKGGHPIPDENSIKGGEEVLRIAEKTTPSDLTFVLISGGGSAMVESPIVPLKDIQETTKLLMERGANIEELNAVRKHLSDIKGGKLLKHLKGRVISLIISDVIGDRLDTIASGPTYFDDTTFSDALNVIEKYGVENEIPNSVVQVIKQGVYGKIPETLKRDSLDIERVQNVLVATNFDACKTAVKYLKSKGYTVIYLGSSIQGEAREVAKAIGGIAVDCSADKLGVPLPAAFVFGGETTVTVHGNGIGGRNEEFVLSSLPFLSKANGVFASVGTDGIDGKSSAAGAIADSDTLSYAAERGIDFMQFLKNNDAERFFERTNSLILTGNTGTNVADIAVLICKRLKK